MVKTMKQNLEYFIGERAEHLAIVYFTRSQNLAIERMTGRDCGIDLLVTVLQDKLPTGRIFGVQVKGRDNAFSDIEQAASITLNPSELHYLKDLPFPVCVLVFTMDDDRGYCRWIGHLNPNRNPNTEDQSQWRCLNEYPVEQLISDINVWYNQKSHNAA
jgi:hypothetical protein